MNALTGYKTYVPLLLVFVHQALKKADMDVFSDAQLADWIDMLLVILAALFKLLSNLRERKQLAHINALQQQVIDCTKK